MEMQSIGIILPRFFDLEDTHGKYSHGFKSFESRKEDPSIQKTSMLYFAYLNLICKTQKTRDCNTLATWLLQV